MPHSFQSITDAIGQPLAAPPDPWTPLPVEDKRAAPMWSPASFDGRGMRAENVQYVDYLSLDFDGPKNERGESLGLDDDQIARITKARVGYATILHTTWSHGLHDRVKLRVTWQLSRSVMPHEWRAFWTRAVAALGLIGVADSNASDATRRFFVPCYEPSRRSLYKANVTEGMALDVDAVLASAALPTDEFPLAPAIVADATFDDLADLAKRLRRQFPNRPTTIALNAIVRGDAFAMPGNRDNALFQVCRDLVQHMPSYSAASVAELFTPSLNKMGSDAPTVWEIEEKIRRAQSDRAKALAAQSRNHSEREAERLRDSFDGDRSDAYTSEELHDRTTRRQPWIVQFENTYWHYHCQRGYLERSKEEAPLSVLTDFAPAIAAGHFVASRPTEKGSDVRLSYPEVFTLNGGIKAEDVEYSYHARRTHYDPISRRLVIVTVEPRVPAVYHAAIDGWISNAFPEHAHQVRQWLAMAPDLARPLVALFIRGEPGAGKSLFARAFAKLWGHESPVDARDALGTFPAQLIRNPLIFADETLPTDYRGDVRSEEIRRLISDRRRDVNRKHKPAIALDGCIRMIAAANNLTALSLKYGSNDDDRRAVIERFRFVEMRRVEGLSQYSEQIIETLAEHAMWLHMQWREGGSPREGRFGLPFDSDAHLKIMRASGTQSKIVELVHAHLVSPNHGMLVNRPKDQELYVSLHDLWGHWAKHFHNEKPPSKRELRACLQTLCDGARQIWHAGRNRRMWIFDQDEILSFAREINGGDDAEERAALALATAENLG